MTTSGTYDFGTNTEIDDLIKESFERIGIIGNEFTGLQIQSAIMSANLELTQWTGKLPLSWMRKRFMLQLYPNQATYQIPTNISSVVDVVATQPERLNTGGTASSSAVASGAAANCFNANSTTGCTLSGTNGWIAYDYGANVTKSIPYVGIKTKTRRTYKLDVEYSFDNANWTKVYSQPSQVYEVTQTVWFVVMKPLNARYWRIKEEGGAILSVEQIYFSQPTNTGTGDRWLGSITETEYVTIANKMSTSFPATYFFDNQITPTLTLWPIPSETSSGNYTNLLYTGYRYIQDVFALYQQFEIPQRFYEALVAGIAWRLAQKFAPDKYKDYKVMANEAFQIAAGGDAANVPIRFQPNFSQYGV